MKNLIIMKKLVSLTALQLIEIMNSSQGKMPVRQV